MELVKETASVAWTVLLLDFQLMTEGGPLLLDLSADCLLWPSLIPCLHRKSLRKPQEIMLGN